MKNDEPITINGAHPPLVAITWTSISILISLLIGAVSFTFSVATLYSQFQHIGTDHTEFSSHLKNLDIEIDRLSRAQSKLEATISK